MEGEAENYFKLNCYQTLSLSFSSISLSYKALHPDACVQMIWVGSLCDREQGVSVLNVHLVSRVLDWQQLTDFLDGYFSPFASQLLLQTHPISKSLACFTLCGKVVAWCLFPHLGFLMAVVAHPVGIRGMVYSEV